MGTQNMPNKKKQKSLLAQGKDPFKPSKIVGLMPNKGVEKSRQQSLNALSSNKLVN